MIHFRYGNFLDYRITLCIARYRSDALFPTGNLGSKTHNQAQSCLHDRELIGGACPNQPEPDGSDKFAPFNQKKGL